MIFFDRGVKRKWLFRGLLIGAAAFVTLFGVDFTVGVLAPRHEQAHPDIKYYYNAIGEEHRIALTFDDGPNEPFTSQILDILKNMGL